MNMEVQNVALFALIQILEFRRKKMDPSFNLVDCPWIPCLYVGETSTREVSLTNVFADASEITEIVHQSPLVTASLHRLLLAILHRTFGPSNSGEWIKIWQKDRWDNKKLSEYFNKWHSRFDLFDQVHPFYQTKSMDLPELPPVSVLQYELASNAKSNPTLFDHNTTHDSKPLGPATAAQYLVARQAFSVSGAEQVKGGGLNAHSAKASPLINGAMILIKGQNLFETLMLNFHRYDLENGEPFEPAEGNPDLPAWERDEETGEGERTPAGYLDLLTWQSRRIRLYPTLDIDGSVIIKHAVVSKGEVFPGSFHPRGKETMLIFKKSSSTNSKANPWPTLKLDENRALWRDSMALLLSLKDQQDRPKTMDWLEELIDDDAIPPELTLRIDVLGLSSTQKKIHFWRHERLPLPLILLKDEAVRDRISNSISIAEQAGYCLNRNAKSAIREFLPEGSKQINGFYSSRACDGRYWSSLDVLFRTFVMSLAHSTSEDQKIRVMDNWAHDVRAAATNAFQLASEPLQRNLKGLRAIGIVESRFRLELSQLTGTKPGRMN
ncbi:type I-E CRISPR-associated protein Cse1/CasA [SAR202 cluster bacterium AD-804-J14_MRT_500m]|nr:type I-E CRISPR-associated protein Cse1/CasA [SAR202 cluster bacterium AD-804-J14_MRT_500m]